MSNQNTNEASSTQRLLSGSEIIAQWQQRAFSTDRHKEALQRLLCEAHDTNEDLAMAVARKQDEIEGLRALIREHEERLIKVTDAIPFAILVDLAHPTRWNGGVMRDLSGSIQSESARSIIAIREALK